jgi:RNA polymerase sigma-70 factor (ECF subfamily)
MTTNQENLLKRARIFDQGALGEIYDQFSDALFAYAFKQVGDSQAAEDLVAETFKRFLIALERGGGPKEHLKAYLYRITHNLITDLYRREPPPSLELDEDRMGEENGDPSLIVSDLQDADIVRKALKLLSPEQRQVIVLRFLEGWTSQEIAHSMDKSLGAVKALQHRGIASLQRILFKEEIK